VKTERGHRYRSRFAANAQDRAQVEALRSRTFAPPGAATGWRDRDSFDARCAHLMIEESDSGRLVAAARVRSLESGADIADCYSALYYDLAPLAGFPAPMIEVGRFCIDAGTRSPNVLRTAWGALAGQVDRQGVQLLFGCASFPGTDPGAVSEALALLASRHRAPAQLAPRRKAPETVRLPDRTHDPAKAHAQMPPLLRSYLRLGAWVSDHAVIDRELGTIHVFTGLEVRNVPPARHHSLSALARDIDAAMQAR